MSFELEKKQKEIEELQTTIKELNDRLNDSEALKSNFISNIMNEVYNPFSSIISMADNIISLKKDNLDKAKSLAEHIYREAAQLDFHLQNIFTAATIEAGLEAIETSNVKVVNIHKNIISKLKFDIDKKGISLRDKIGKELVTGIYTDAKKLSLILLNLITNAIKNSPENGKIECIYGRVDDILNISISDQGPGIDMDEMDKIFDRFKRIDATINSVTGGTGLGLSVVKALIEIMNGNLLIINDKGTKVTLSIPCISMNQKGDNFEDDAILFDEEVF